MRSKRTSLAAGGAAPRIINTDIAIIGGSLGGVAAAIAACEAGASVILTEEYAWLGGQATSQGVSALDEHAHIERCGGTRSYYAFREAIREHYRQTYGVAAMPDGAPLNPGNGWVSHLCYEPRLAAAVIETMLAPHVAAGKLMILRQHAPVAAQFVKNRVVAVRAVSLVTAQPSTIAARLFLDATDCGDLLPLIGAPYRVGAESRAQTGETLAPEAARPSEIQGFTFCFAVELCPGEDHTIAPPPDYTAIRDRQPFTLTLTGDDGEPRPFRVFATGPTGLPPFWTYRRLLDGALLGHTTRDLAMINWNSNDYHHGAIIDITPALRERHLREAKDLSLAFLYWLQTECARDDGGVGYPELRLVPEAMGTDDGLSMAPYIRESRRIVARTTIIADDILASSHPGARARRWPDSVGIGWYFMDLHPAPGNPSSRFTPTRPFQIPLGALIPQHHSNLLAACKNIGTTHLSNGSYRLHPVEWNIGEAAGALAVYCLEHDITPAALHAGRDGQLAAFQDVLLARGVPLAWALDVPLDHQLWADTQRLLLAGAIAPGTPRDGRLAIGLDQPLSGAESTALLAAIGAVAAIAALAPIGELDGHTDAADPRWIADPTAIAAAGAWRAMLPAAQLSDPPTWAEVVLALSPAR